MKLHFQRGCGGILGGCEDLSEQVSQGDFLLALVPRPCLAPLLCLLLPGATTKYPASQGHRLCLE